MICRNFEPVFAPEAKVLIVGSMPGVRSLEAQQYYAHPRNAFWPILFDVFGKPMTENYEERKALICEHSLELWDAAAFCEREGSLDSNMRAVVYSDFAALYRQCPGIHTVLCNGGTAHALFMKSGAAGQRCVLRMPSTSPAYTMAYAKKLEAWKTAIVQALNT